MFGKIFFVAPFVCSATYSRGKAVGWEEPLFVISVVISNLNQLVSCKIFLTGTVGLQRQIKHHGVEDMPWR